MATLKIYSNDGQTLLFNRSRMSWGVSGSFYTKLDDNGYPVIGQGASASAVSSWSRMFTSDLKIDGYAFSSNQTQTATSGAFGPLDYNTRTGAFQLALLDPDGEATNDVIYYTVGEVMPVNYRNLSYTDAKIQVDSAIRDGNGVRIDTNYQRKPQVIEYTVPSSVATGYQTIAEYNGTYNGSPGYVKFVMEVTSSSYKGIYTIEASWGQAAGNITLVSGNGVSSDASQVNIYYPSSTSYYAYPPLLSVYNASTREKHVKITILEDSGELTWETDWTAYTSTSYRTSAAISLFYKSYVNRADSANSSSTASYSNFAYATRTGTFRTGEVDTSKIMTTDSTGVAYKINTSGKKFPLPISMYLGANNAANATAYNSYSLTGGQSTSYTSVSYLSSASYNNFTLPTLTASDGAKTLYIRGSLDSDGYFVCDGNVTLSMEAGYTYIPFGTLDPRYSGSTAQVPTTYSFNAISAPAYTLDANGKLTHIDGKQIAPKVTVSDQDPSGGSNGDIWIQY